MTHLRSLLVALVPMAVIARSASAQEVDVYADADPAALSDFHATLDPVGGWADDDVYGTVWVPNPTVVGPDFAPYATGGHWVYGDDYTWVSDYDWGWAPFHYGRWVNIEGRGWSWIAGRQYAPAWVSWGVGEPGVGYVAWGPAPPEFFWRGGVAVPLAIPLAPRLVYAPSAELFHPRLAEQLLRGPQVGLIAPRIHPFEERPVAGGARFLGPPLAHLGVEPARVVRVTGAEPGLVRAQSFARPSVAVRYGARPPTVRPAAAPGPVERWQVPHPPERAPVREEPRGAPPPAVRAAPAPMPPAPAHGGGATPPVQRGGSPRRGR